ncbi:Avra10-like protein [Blumeria hordei DH14]|uniref:Avra10-like protein n=1 Tax=Blumeria graminis f. sp. hordei (strain DH14) TaxID=546991 RepID=N1JI60_BLUG1|nr:Avra10-like protein [Blumeria hordei DH14]
MPLEGLLSLFSLSQTAFASWILSFTWILKLSFRSNHMPSHLKTSFGLSCKFPIVIVLELISLHLWKCISFDLSTSKVTPRSFAFWIRLCKQLFKNKIFLAMDDEIVIRPTYRSHNLKWLVLSKCNRQDKRSCVNDTSSAHSNDNTSISAIHDNMTI